MSTAAAAAAQQQQQQHPLVDLPTEDVLRAYATLRQVEKDTDLSTHQRLANLLQERQGKVRTLMRTTLGLGTVAPTDVQPAILAAAGLTLTALRQHDPRLSAEHLVRARIITSREDLRLLGVATFADVLRDVGPPRRLRRWFGDDVWPGLVRELRVDAETWFAHRRVLAPADVAALGVHLDTWFDQAPSLWERVLHAGDGTTWLASGKPDQWVERAGLSLARQRALSSFSKGRASAITTPATTTTTTTSNSSTWI